VSVFGVQPRAVRLFFVVAVAVVLAACTVLSGTPLVTYELSVPPAVAKANSTSGVQILVPEPTAVNMVDSDRIVVNTGSRVSYYPGVQWPDRLPKVLQNKLIEAFEQSGRARAVGRPGEGLSVDYQILTDIRAFTYDASRGSANVEIFAKILNDRTGKVVGSQLFAATIPVSQDSAEAVVAGLDQALQSVLGEMVGWSRTRFP
jgi:cholesterol transport system auxiliary component